MTGALRTFLGSRWPVLGMFGAALACVAAIWALLGDGSVSFAVLSLAVALALIGVVMVGLIARTAEHRMRHVDTRLRKVQSTAVETSATVDEIRQVQADPTGGVLGELLGAKLDAQQLDAAERHDKLVDAVESLRADLTGLTERVDNVGDDMSTSFEDLRKAGEVQLSELSALTNLYTLFDPDDEVPVLGGFAASPQTILRLTSLVLRMPDDGLIVECGSGASTVWFSFACRKAGRGRVVALEHEELYADRTREALARHGLTPYADVRVAPLESVNIAGESYDWYARKQWDDLTDISMLFVDGPPGSVALRSRFPAFPLLASALADGAIVALDDVHRDAEAAIGTEWESVDFDGELILRNAQTVGRTRLFQVARPGE